MKQMNNNIRTKLIDAIAKGNTKQIKEAVDEINGKVFRVRNFVDLMIASSIIDDPENDTKIIYDLDKEFDEVMKRANERKKQEGTK